MVVAAAVVVAAVVVAAVVVAAVVVAWVVAGVVVEDELPLPPQPAMTAANAATNAMTIPTRILDIGPGLPSKCAVIVFPVFGESTLSRAPSRDGERLSLTT